MESTQIWLLKYHSLPNMASSVVFEINTARSNQSAFRNFSAYIFLVSQAAAHLPDTWHFLCVKSPLLFALLFSFTDKKCILEESKTSRWRQTRRSHIQLIDMISYFPGNPCAIYLENITTRILIEEMNRENNAEWNLLTLFVALIAASQDRIKRSMEGRSEKNFLTKSQPCVYS